MGKTETIKERAIYVYLPSIEMKERWEKHAEELGVSVSKFVIEYVENSLRQEAEPTYKSREELIKENEALRQQINELSKRCRLLETAADRLEEELRAYRAKPFLEEQFEGVRAYGKELIDILKSRGIVSSEDILAHLGVNPTEHEAVKAISRQLENLEAWGLVKSSVRGWKWTG
jgi:FtsZ-binding cell division protein ZapB